MNIFDNVYKLPDKEAFENDILYIDLPTEKKEYLNIELEKLIYIDKNKSYDFDQKRQDNTTNHINIYNFKATIENDSLYIYELCLIELNEYIKCYIATYNSLIKTTNSSNKK